MTTITNERLAHIADVLQQWSQDRALTETSRAVYVDTVTALRELERRRELSGPMAPIARVTVEDCGVWGEVLQVTHAKLYAPGLPPGEHDLYPEPPQHEIGPLPGEGE